MFFSEIDFFGGIKTEFEFLFSKLPLIISINCCQKRARARRQDLIYANVCYSSCIGRNSVGGLN